MTKLTILAYIKTNIVSKRRNNISRKGLSLNIISETAAQLIEEKGYDNFTLHELARQLHVKISSLYNYISSLSELNYSIAKLSAERLNSRIETAVFGKFGKEALFSTAIAYRDFAKEHLELYKTILKIPSMRSSELTQTGMEIIKKLYDMLEAYYLNIEERLLFCCSFRSALHGFISLGFCGFFKENPEDSFLYLVELFLSSLEKEKENE